MTDSHLLFATTPRGLEASLRDELRSLGATSLRPLAAGVSFRGDLTLAYRVCLWSRLANRVLLPLHDFEMADAEGLYDGIQAIDWASHMSVEGTLAVDLLARDSKVIRHTHFGALKVKDAIVDQFREATGKRPSVDRERPDIRVNVYVDRNRVRVALDLSGESLHRRGYRAGGAQAPLKENLAAGLLSLAGWPAGAEQAFLDPMCGSGTLVIEAGLMAGDVAPGLGRDYFGFLGWRGHQAEIWRELLSEARARAEIGLSSLPRIVGYDADRHAITQAVENLQRAGLHGLVHVEKRELDQIEAIAGQGLLLVNPPYGKRLGERSELGGLYARLGKRLKQAFGGWRAAVFSSEPELLNRLRLPVERGIALFNGPLRSRLVVLELPSGAAAAGEPVAPLAVVEEAAPQAAPVPGLEAFNNRLRKNRRKFARWAAQQGIQCYRLYDADLPEFALAIDIYAGDESWLHVQEYQAPRSVDEHQAQARLDAAMASLPQVLEIPADRIHLKTRRRQKGSEQYQRVGRRQERLEVREGGHRFEVNLSDYLDTGLFLDHRPMRGMIQRSVGQGHFLNLFCYTATASVYAAAGGAASTTSVDMSATYLEWAARNFALNDMTDDKLHRLVRADCLSWLKQQGDKPGRRYDLIFLDPPTFSNSKRMQGSLDIQRDHVMLIRRSLRLLQPHGVLLFSTNQRRFKINSKSLSGLALEDISRQTIPKDYERNQRIHQCWRITRNNR